MPPQGAKRESTGRSPTAWFVLACGFVLAILAWRGAAGRLEERRRLVFDHQVEAVSDGILQRVHLYETVARAAAAFFQRSGSMTRAEWAAFVDQMDLDLRHPGIPVLEAALRVPAAGLQRHIDAVRAEGFPDYDVHPPGPRAEYFPIVYLEPWEHNRAAFGYDVLAEARRRAAAERARDTGEASITEPIQLVQDADVPARPAYLMFVPIYRGIGASPTPDDRRVRLAGFITGAFHVADLVAGVSPDRRPGVDFALYDGPVEASSAPLYADAPVATGASTLRRDVRLDVGGRAWTLRFGARPWLDPSLDAGEPHRVLFAGLVGTLLLFAIVRTQAQAERRAIALADEMTVVVREREARLRTIVDAEPECVKTVSLEGLLLEMNPAGLAMVEAESLDEVVGRPVVDLVHPDDREAFRALHDRVAGGASGMLTFRVVGLRGGVHWMETISVPLRDRLGAVTSVLSVTRDVTERQHAEGELRVSEARYRNIVETAVEGIWVIDADDRTTFVNQRMVEMLGYEEREIVGQRPYDLLGANEDPDARARLARRRAGISEQYDIELIRKDGGRTWALVSTRPTFDDAGQYAGLLAMFTDITERRAAFNAYRESQALISSIVENSPNMIFVKDAANLRFVLFNKAGEDLLGYRREELLGKSDYDFFPEEEADFFTTKDREVLSSGRVVEIPDESVQTRLGPRHLRTVKVPILDATGRPQYLLGISEDITDRQHLEQQLRDAQKMEAIGALAGGLAHDFNNILACILGYGDLARIDCRDNPSALESLRNMIEAGERGKGLVGQLLTFARRQAEPRVPVDPGIAAASAVSLLRPTVPAGVEVRLDVEAAVPAVLADATQLHQLITNLLTNGVQAMEERGGHLDLTVSRVEVSEAMAARESELSPGPWVRIAVRDQGPGIDPVTRKRIFEPFFTTKSIGRGVGLGLAVVHGIVTSHGGAILVRSELGQGTTFEVFLPICEGAPAQSVAALSATPRGHGERILFIDDEVQLAELGRRVLEGLGYRVTALTDPVDAAAMFRAGPDAFDLVVTDLMMPALNGAELAEEVLRIRPGTPVLVSTGFEAWMSPETARSIGVRGVVKKPNTVDALARAVHGALMGTA